MVGLPGAAPAAASPPAAAQPTSPTASINLAAAYLLARRSGRPWRRRGEAITASAARGEAKATSRRVSGLRLPRRAPAREPCSRVIPTTFGICPRRQGGAARRGRAHRPLRAPVAAGAEEAREEQGRAAEENRRRRYGSF